jgi:two-component system nitrate/nitrite response regulator NarL
MIRILIADPDSATRKALTSLLQRKLASSTLIEVENIETLICELAGTPPDLLIMDWRLHGAPAPETCRLVRKAYPHLKVILLSVDASDATASRDAGAVFVHKGGPPDELIAILKPLLSGKAIDAEVSDPTQTVS